MGNKLAVEKMLKKRPSTVEGSGVQASSDVEVCSDSKARSFVSEGKTHQPFQYNSATLQPEQNQKQDNSRLEEKMAKSICERIECRLHVTFQENPCLGEGKRQVSSQDFTFPDFAWHKADSYAQIKEKCVGFIQKFREERGGREYLDGDHIYLRHGSCQVASTANENKCDSISSLLNASNFASQTIRSIMDFKQASGIESLSLNLSCDYGALVLQPKIGRSFKDETLIQLEDLLKVNRTIRNQKYISGAELDELINVKIPERLIDEDQTLTSEKKDNLKLAMRDRGAQRLLLFCFHGLIPLEMFEHFLLDTKHNYSDNHLPRRDGYLYCQMKNCDRYHEIVTKTMHKFFATRIFDDHCVRSRHEDDVMPVSYVENGTLGKGELGRVYEVCIDPAYRGGGLLATELSTTHALRIFAHKAPDYISKEALILTKLTNSHHHILKPITGWEQANSYYILYDKADCNLQSYMNHNMGGDLSSQRILWFLSQLRGLADAVNQIHKFEDLSTEAALLEPVDERCFIIETIPSAWYRIGNPLELSSNSTDFQERKKILTSKIAGHHHGIKLKNILVFEQPGQLPLLKMSDFEAGKFVTATGKSFLNLAQTDHETEAYFGPEYLPLPREEMGRPFDIWALGCIYLEILLWLLGMNGNVMGTGKSFAAYRLDPDEYYSSKRYNYFWRSVNAWTVEPGTKSLKCLNIPSRALNIQVEKLLDNLEKHYCNNMEVFLQFVSIIRKLLVIEPRDRLRAEEIVHALDQLLAQAESELQSDPTYYMAQFQENLKSASQPEQSTDARQYSDLNLSTSGDVLEFSSEAPAFVSLLADLSLGSRFQR